MKKILITLFISLLVSINTVYAEDIYTEGYYYYTIENNSITVTGYFGKEKTITIPDNIGGYPVNTIAAHAFEDADTVEKVNLPNTITTIGENAFKADVSIIYAGYDINGSEAGGNTGGGNNNSGSNVGDNTTITPSSNETQNSTELTPSKGNSENSVVDVQSGSEIKGDVSFDEADVSLDDVLEEEILEDDDVTAAEVKTNNTMVYVIPAVILIIVSLVVIIRKLVK